MNATTIKVFEKKLHFPTVCVGVGQGKGCKTLEVEIRLDTQLCKDWETLEEKRMYVFGASAHGMRHWGQCLDYLQTNAERYIMPESKRELFNRICEIWNEYHLNDLQGGTRKQTEHLTKELHRADHYTEACEYLKSIDLFEDRGYKYGHGWLCKEIPSEIVDEIMTWQEIEDESKEEIARIRRQMFNAAKKEETK